MLILMRRPGETICVGNDVTVTVLGIERNRVRLGIKAPREVTVDRAEVAEKKRLGIDPPSKRVASSSG
jgi:carbon storage regulator